LSIRRFRVANETATKAGGSAVGQLQKVLIVEDEKILAENLMTHIQRCGWEVRVAPTGRQAVAAAIEFLPEVILLDYCLPDMDGFQVLDAIYPDQRACRCVLMTGHPTDTLLDNARRRGIQCILCKPFLLSELESHLSATAAELPSPPLPRRSDS
jgi:DNA-binding response OmpR family regulator